MYRNISTNQEKVMRRMYADCIHNLSLSENRNNQLNDIDIAYYKGIVITAISGIMGYLGCNWFTAMLVLNSLLPADHLSLNYILPEPWQDILDDYGRIIAAKCLEQERSV